MEIMYYKVGKRSAWQIFASNIPIFKAILRTETGNLMIGLPTILQFTN